MAEDTKQFHARTLAFFDALSQAPDLQHLDVRVAWRIVTRLNVNNDGAWPSYNTLAREVGASRRTVIRSVQRLVEHGWFTVRTHYRPYDLNASNLYRPNYEMVTRASPHPDGGADSVSHHGGLSEASPTTTRNVTQCHAASRNAGGSVTGDTRGGDTGDTRGGDIRVTGVVSPVSPKPSHVTYPAGTSPEQRHQVAVAARNDAGTRNTSPTPVPAEAPKTAWQGQRRDARAASNPYEKEERVDEALAQARRTARQRVSDRAFDEIARTSLSIVLDDAWDREWDREGAGQAYVIGEVERMAAELESGAAE